MQLLRYAERCPDQIRTIVDNAGRCNVEQHTADPLVIYRSKVRPLPINLVFEELSQFVHLAREDLVSPVEGTAQRNRRHAEHSKRRAV